MYYKFKSDTTPVQGEDESLYYYAIGVKWMLDWRKFANGETS
jgi:hypothetical protein